MQLLFYVLYFYLFSFIFININSKPFSLEQANITAILSAAAYCNKNDLYNIVWREPAKGFQITDITIFKPANELDTKNSTRGIYTNDK
jgi:hypothetical protein